MGRKSIAHIRRKEIIEGFFQIVAEKGFANASIREITLAAGASTGVLHHYFVNKEAMVLGVMDHVLKTYMAEYNDGLGDHQSAREQLEYFFSWFLDLDRFDMEFSRAWMEFWALSKTNTAISEAMTNCYGQIVELLAQIIRIGIESGEFAEVDPRLTANVILSSLEGITLLWVVSPEATPVEAMNEKIAEIYLDYLRPKNGG